MPSSLKTRRERASGPKRLPSSVLSTAPSVDKLEPFTAKENSAANRKMAALAKALKRPALKDLFVMRPHGPDAYERGAVFDTEWDDDVKAWKDGQKRMLGRVVEVIPEPRGAFLVLFDSVRRYRVTDAIRKAATALGMTKEGVTPSSADMFKFMQGLESHGAKTWNL